MLPPTFLNACSILLGAVLATLMLGGSARADDDNDADAWTDHVGGGVAVVGSGRMASQARSVGPFRAVDLKGAMTLVLRQGAKEAVEVRADDNLLALVETRVVDRHGVPTLQIGTRRGVSYSTRHRMVVTVDVVALDALALSGAGDAHADGLALHELQVRLSGSGDLHLKQFSADALALKISGSGDVTVAGRAARLDVDVVGSGDVRAADLAADDVRLSIAGSGDASVNARKTLSVKVAGSGDVDYRGDAAVTVSVAGSGSVKKH